MPRPTPLHSAALAAVSSMATGVLCLALQLTPATATERTAFLIPSAQSSTTSDVQAVHHLILEQVEAMRNNDRAKAYDLASASLKQEYGDKEIFALIYREIYAPVVTARKLSFGRMKVQDDRAVQEVFATGEDGTSWLAVFTLSRDGTSQWKISGCRIKSDTSGSA